MLQRIPKMVFSFIITAVLIAGFFAVPQHANAGNGPIFPFFPPNTDSENFQLVGYYDLRDRQTFFQVTNTSAQNIRIHIQVFDFDNNCFEFDYFDTMTPFDTHVYDISNLDRNDGTDFNPPILSGHGIVAITHVGPATNFINTDPVLTGNFRIIDDAGYEYRTNFAGPQLILNGLIPINGERPVYNAHFNDVDGTTFNDLAIISFLTVANPGGVVPGLGLYSVGLFDDQENPISCPQIILGCSAELSFIFGQQFQNLINVGVNQFITNSRGAQSLCQGTDPRGFVQLRLNFFDADFGSFNGQEPVSGGVIIYMGLNDGQSIGSMDHIIQSFEEFEFNGELPSSFNEEAF